MRAEQFSRGFLLRALCAAEDADRDRADFFNSEQQRDPHEGNDTDKRASEEQHHPSRFEQIVEQQNGAPHDDGRQRRLSGVQQDAAGPLKP